MSIICEKSEINKLISDIQQYYINEFNEKTIMMLGYYVVIICEKMQHYLEPQKESGIWTYIMPNCVTDKSIALIDEDLFYRECPAIGTIFHELTHASDFNKFLSWILRCWIGIKYPNNNYI